MTKKAIRILIITISAVLMMGGIVFAEEKQLTHYEPYSEWAQDVGFKHMLIFLDNPQRAAQRWEIVNLLDSISTITDDYEFNQEDKFNDLQEVSEDICNKIKKANALGIVNGYDDGTFRPFNTVSRAEFVVFLDRYGILREVKSTSNVFSDVNGKWFEKSVYKAVNTGIISGKSANEFYPNDTITLEEILIILDRMQDKDIIDENELIFSITTTFNSRIYSEEEKYMVEDIYPSMKKVQHDVNIYKYSLKGYDVNDMGQVLTLRDALVFLVRYRSNSVLNFETHTDSVTESRIRSCCSCWTKSGEYKFGIGPDTPIDYDRPVTVRELINAINEGTEKKVAVNMSNFSELTEYEKKDLEGMIYSNLLPNSSNYFPIDSYVTKAFLNYIIVAYNDTSVLGDSYEYTFCRRWRNCAFETEMDETTYPSNHILYPFILRPIANEIYEIPFLNASNMNSKSPAQLWDEDICVGCAYKGAVDSGIFYLKTLVNVDYTTICQDNFGRVLCDYAFYSPYTSDYMKYVKENEIKLEGTVEPCIPIMYYDGETRKYRVRMHVKFKVVHSNTNENLLLGDELYYYQYREHYLDDSVYKTIYKSNEYDFYVDLAMMEPVSRMWGQWSVDGDDFFSMDKITVRRDVGEIEIVKS